MQYVYSVALHAGMSCLQALGLWDGENQALLVMVAGNRFENVTMTAVPAVARWPGRGLSTVDLTAYLQQQQQQQR